MSKSRMKLTDLNIDCLEGILEYLELGDLLNVADSNKRLCHASKFVFIHKYGNAEFYFGQIYTFSQLASENMESIEIDGIYINVNYLKSILQFLRNFGHLTSQIMLRLGPYPSTADHIHISDYINDFSHETLITILIMLARDDILDCFNNPFKSVKTVDIASLSVSESLVQKNILVQLFPKMEKLTLSTECSRLFTHSECIANHFPYLEYFKLEFFNKCHGKNDNSHIKNYKSFLKLNPQLKHLYLDCKDEAEIDLLEVFVECVQNPERLELHDWGTFFTSFNGKKFHLKNLKHLTIGGYPSQPIVDGIPFLCNQLESFEIDLGNPYTEFVYDFCEKNSTIKKLKIGFKFYSYFIDYSRLAQSLPLLEEMTELYGRLSVDEVFHVLALFRSLKYFQFNCSERSECDQIRSRLNDNWSMQFTEEKDRQTVYFITLKR